MNIIEGTTRTGLFYRLRSAAGGGEDPAVLSGLGLCLREEYADTYVDPRVYDQDRMARDVAQGHLVIAMAFSRENEPMACICLRENAPFSGIGDVCMHVVRRQFRGLGLGTPLVKYVVNLPAAARFSAIGSHNATFHALSQRESYAAGLRPCALLLSLYRSEGFRHSHPNVGAKLSYAVSTRAPANAGPVPLYVPPAHRPFLERVYGDMGAAPRWEDPSPGLAAGPSRLNPVQDQVHNTLVAAVERCGADLGDQAAALLAEYGSRPLQTATFCVNALDPSAPAGCAALESLGFRFTGVQPFCRGAHYLLYHHPLGVPVPFDEFHIDGTFDFVFRYVRDQFAAPAGQTSGGARP